MVNLLPIGTRVVLARKHNGDDDCHMPWGLLVGCTGTVTAHAVGSNHTWEGRPNEPYELKVRVDGHHRNPGDYILCFMDMLDVEEGPW